MRKESDLTNAPPTSSDQPQDSSRSAPALASLPKGPPSPGARRASPARPLPAAPSASPAERALRVAVADLRDEVRDLKTECATLRRARLERDAEVEHLQRIVCELEAALEGPGQAPARQPPAPGPPTETGVDTRLRIHRLEERLEEMTRHAGALQHRIDHIVGSRAWRLFRVYSRIKESLARRA